MLINIVSMNIIFGIIIDTFAELRDAQNTRDDDFTNTCFICGFSRDVFEKQGLSFDKHVTYQHNPTNYINFLIHLRTKPEDEFDGVEDYVFTQYQNNKTNWAPIENTLYIKPDEDEIDTDGKIENLNDYVEGQTTDIKELLESVDSKMDTFGIRMKKMRKDTLNIQGKVEQSCVELLELKESMNKGPQGSAIKKR